jgi:sulfoxide reductase catalytic subunit YedY
MLVRSRPLWELAEAAATPESIYLDRRSLIKAAGLPLIAAAGLWPALGRGEPAGPGPGRREGSEGSEGAVRNPRYGLDRALSDALPVTTYNNFYEFGSHKEIAGLAQSLKPRPWTVTLDGLVETPRTLDFEALLAAMPVEERLYRHRCVETWAMAVPWLGFPLAALVAYARPLGSAKYLTMQTFKDASVAPGQKQFWYPWPYTEGLSLAEATNELAFIATGLYGRPMPPQNGAPLRLVVPWKYGFKSVKSIVRFHFSETRPVTFWQTLGPSEYGFWANVNPQVPHPRWSQASERMLGTGERRPTQLFNGYAEFVAGLYTGLEAEPLYM